MKILSAILSVYFLLLSVVPCADGSDAAQVEVHEEILADHDHSGHDHPPGEDLCTPLCACQCCHTNITISSFIVLDNSPVEVQSAMPFYLEHPSASFPAPLLDPPRV